MRQAYKFKLYAADRNSRLNRQRIVACQIWNQKAVDYILGLAEIEFAKQSG
jgi:hypothetical protein